MKLSYIVALSCFATVGLYASNDSSRDESLLVPRVNNLQANTFSAIAPFSLEALNRYPNIDVGVLSPDGIPEFLAGDLGAIKGTPSSASSDDIIRGASKALDIIGLSKAKFTLVSRAIEKNGDGHFKFTCSYKGIQIDGSEIVIHVNQAGIVFCLNGDIPDVRVLEKLSTKGKKSIGEISDTCKKYYHNTNAKEISPALVFHHSSRDRGTRLAWKTAVATTEAESETLYVDDESGLITDVESPRQHALTRKVNMQNNQTWTYSETTNYNSTPATVSVSIVEGSTIIQPTDPDYYAQNQYPYSRIAALAATNTYNYFTNLQASTYNEQFTMILNAINRYNQIDSGSSTQTPWTQDSCEAFYYKNTSGTKYLIFGAGDGYTYRNMASDSEVVSHEFSHMYLMRTMTFAMQGEARAISEAYGDCVSKLVGRYTTSPLTTQPPYFSNWNFGTTAFIADAAHPNRHAIRCMNNPITDGISKDYYPNRDTVSSDEDQAHNNAGILNLAFYLMLNGGRHPQSSGKPDIIVPKINIDRAADGWVNGMQFYGTSQMLFANFRYCVINRLKSLYPNTFEAQNANLAFAAVGMPSIVDNPRPINLSSKGIADSGSNVHVVGFSVAGTGSKNFLIRAVGSELSHYESAVGLLPDPAIVVNRVSPAPNEVIAQNDNWSNDAAISSLGAQLYAFALDANSTSAALITPVSSGMYTATIDPKSQVGRALFEIYDGNPNLTSLGLVNLSARENVPVGAKATIGFCITGYAEKKYLIRAVGPGLAQWLTGTMANPRLKIFSGGDMICTNDEWSNGSAQDSLVEAAATQTGAFPLTRGSHDAAMLISLPPGQYTAEADSVDGSAGIIIFEIYVVN